MSKEMEIVTEILRIPLDQWVDNKAEIKGLNVIFNPMYNGMAPFFEINGYKFYDERIKSFKYELYEYHSNISKQIESSKINEIHSKIFG